MFLESYIEMTLTSTINILHVRSYRVLLSLIKLNFTTNGDKASSILSIIVGSIMYTLPIMMIIFLVRNLKVIDDPDIVSRYGSFY
jgi:hypothetical protein